MLLVLMFIVDPCLQLKFQQTFKRPFLQFKLLEILDKFLFSRHLGFSRVTSFYDACFERVISQLNTNMCSNLQAVLLHTEKLKYNI